MTPDAESPLLTGDASLVDAENPWPGLTPFSEKDWQFFHGREPETDALIRLIQRGGLTVLFGLSGLGKTSLLRAGLFPRVREAHFLPVYIRLDFAPDSPGLSRQLYAAIAQDAAAARVEAPARESATLWEYFHRQGADFWSARNRLVVPLLVFDQFEEVFTLGRVADRWREADAFLDELTDLVEGRVPGALKARLDDAPEKVGAFTFTRHPYKILVSLREDFLPDLEGLRDRMPSVVHNRLRLRRMNGDQALRVVIEAGPHLVEAGVAARIVDFVAGARAVDRPLRELEVEPALLSVVCRELNEKRRQRGDAGITANLLEGSRTAILANFYERSLAQVATEVRAFIEDRLLTASGYRDSVAAESALATPGVTAETIERLVACRLLRVELRGGVPRLELTHDVLAPVARRSRDARREREAQVRAEAARREAEARERRARRKLRRSRRTAAFLLAMLDWGFAAQKRAERALAHSDFREAVTLAAEDRAAQALGYLARAVRLDPENLPARSLLFDLLLYRSWPLRLVNIPHAERVVAGELSPNGRLLVTGAGVVAQLCDARTGRPTRAPMMHASPLRSAHFSPDGTRLVTVARHVARVWNVATGKPVGIGMEHEDHIRSARFGPDGTRIVTASADWTAQVWDAASGEAIGGRLGHSGAVGGAEFNSDGTRIVTASADETARIWDVGTGREIGKPLRHANRVQTALFSPNGRQIVTVTGDGSVLLWDSTSWQTPRPAAPTRARHAAVLHRAERGGSSSPLEEPAKRLPHSALVVSVAFSPNGSRVLTASADRTARVWDAESGQPVGDPIRHARALTFATFSPEGARVVTASQDGTARVWNAETGAAIGEPMHHEHAVDAAQFGPEGTRALTVSGNVVSIWDVQPGWATAEPLRHAGEVYAAHFDASGVRVVTGSNDGRARVWDAASGRLLAETTRDEHGIRAAAFSPDGARLAIASGDTVRVQDVATGRPVSGPMSHAGSVKSVQFSPDGSRLLTAALDEARIWDPATGEALGTPIRQPDAVRAASFAPDGRRVVTAAGKCAYLWDVLTGDAAGASLPHEQDVRSVAFSPDGTCVLTGGQDGIARIWDPRTSQVIAEMRHLDRILFARFSRDGRRVVTASADRTATVWDAATGRPIVHAIPHGDAVRCAEFSPDGTRIVTAAGDAARIWEVPTVTAEAPGILASLAEAVGGYTVSEFGLAVPLPDVGGGLGASRSEALPEQVGAPPLVRWFLADRATRTISPLSTITVPEFIQRRLAEGTEAARREAERAYPGHPLLVAAPSGGRPREAPGH